MKKIFVIIALFSGLILSAQNQLKSYQWRDHLPYNQTHSVTHQGNKIFAVSNECAFSFNKSDNSYERLNKVYGYSDIEPVIIKNNPYNNAVVIIYKNSNIDVLKGGAIINVSDLLRKQNIGDKTVNSITFKDQYAYLACGFGIVVFNTETYEFKDDYIIGPGATNLDIYQVALSNTEIFAATKSGLYHASLSPNTNLDSYTSWSKYTNLPNGPYNGVVYFGGKIITNFSKNILSAAYMQDTLYQYDGTTWSKYTAKQYQGTTYTVNKLIVSDDNSKLLTIDQWGFESFDANGNTMARIWNFNLGWTVVEDVIPDPTDYNWYWVATSTNGFMKAENQYSQSNPNNNNALAVQKFSINGPTTPSSSSIAIKDDKVIVASSYLGFDMFNNYYFNGVYHFDSNVWGETPALAHDTPYPFVDINSVAFDNNDKKHYYGSSWWNGVVEFVNDVEVNHYTCLNTNGGLHATDYPSSTMTRSSGLAMDKDNNLWIGMGETQSLLSVRKSDGSWASLDFTIANSVNGSVGPLPRISRVIIDSTKQVWAVAYGLGLFVYQYDGSWPPTQPNFNHTNNAKKLINVAGFGGLPSLQVISIAEDKNGDIWVGTDKGIYVFYNPESIFTQASGWDAQPIYIQQDGKTQLLLQTDEVTAITVDGANNKWCGTRTSGLYCFSSDGQKQLYHFTADDSPLFSNTITDIRVNPRTGEVFIGTDKGMLSFQNIVVEGFDKFTNVYAFPNPVKPDYEGPILIHGMINGAVVKILDVAGNFVFETTSKGGQAIWDGKNFSGRRVASGVYIVLCTTSDGEQKIMTKILLLN